MISRFLFWNYCFSESGPEVEARHLRVVEALHVYSTLSDSLAGPSDSLAGPSDSLAGPSDSLAGPSDSLAGPSDDLFE
jgi:hypothetical protein